MFAGENSNSSGNILHHTPCEVNVPQIQVGETHNRHGIYIMDLCALEELRKDCVRAGLWGTAEAIARYFASKR